ncbi:MAG: hypothetical protein JWQ02_1149, partial [Capsulimonas sp.]|nr:hypothetical protein [Capsulimonas sp.]
MPCKIRQSVIAVLLGAFLLKATPCAYAHADRAEPTLHLLHIFHHKAVNDETLKGATDFAAIFTKDSRKLICAMDRCLFIWDIRGKRLEKTLLTNTDVKSMDVSSDGQYLVT